MKGQLQTWNRREVSSEWTGCQAQLHKPKKKKSHDGNSVIKIKCDGLTTIFLPDQLFHDSELYNNLNMSTKSIYLLLIRRKTFLLDLGLQEVIEDTLCLNSYCSLLRHEFKVLPRYFNPSNK